jgi:predicted kinase
LKTVWLMIGPSGVGKSTWAMKKMEEVGGNCTYLNADSIRGELYGDPSIQGDGNQVFSLLKARYAEALSDPLIDNIFIDNTSLSYRDRKGYYDGKNDFVLVYFKVPVETALQRNSQRTRQVPRDVILRQYRKIQPPTDQEVQAHKVIEVSE